MVATTLVTVFLSHTFPRDPALQPLSFVFTFVPRPSLKILSPVATHPPSREISSLGDIAPPLPPPREKFKRGGNLRDSLPPPPPRGIRGERRKADRKFPSLWIKVFSKLLPSLPPSPRSSPAIFFYRSKLPLRGFEETEEGTLDDVFYIFVVVLNLPRSKFSGWNSVQLQDQPGGDLRD